MRAGEHADLPGGMDANIRALVQSRLGTERADDGRGCETAGLDVSRQADADIPALRARARLFRSKLAVADPFQREVERRRVVAAVVEQRHRRLIREALR